MYLSKKYHMILNSVLELNTLNNRGFWVMKKNVSTSSTLPVNILGQYILNYVNIPLATLHIDINIEKSPSLHSPRKGETSTLRLRIWEAVQVSAGSRLFHQRIIVLDLQN